MTLGQPGTLWPGSRGAAEYHAPTEAGQGIEKRSELLGHLDTVGALYAKSMFRHGRCVWLVFYHLSTFGELQAGVCSEGKSVCSVMYSLFTKVGLN